MLLWTAICHGFVACADLSFLHLYVLGDGTDNSLSFHLLTFLQSRAVFPGCNYNGKWCILLIKTEKYIFSLWECCRMHLASWCWREIKIVSNLSCFGVVEFAAGADSWEFRLWRIILFHLCALDEQVPNFFTLGARRDQHHYFHFISWSRRGDWEGSFGEFTKVAKAGPWAPESEVLDLCLVTWWHQLDNKICENRVHNCWCSSVQCFTVQKWANELHFSCPPFLKHIKGSLCHIASITE